MLEYRRLHREESQRANELEAQKRVLAASMQAVEVCWTQVSRTSHSGSKSCLSLIFSWSALSKTLLEIKASSHRSPS